jgi:hypothetical protein
MFQMKVVDKIKTHIFCSINHFRKSCCVWDNVEIYGGAGQATDDSIIGRMRFACCLTKATNTQSEFVMPFAFPRYQWLHDRACLVQNEF